MPAAVVPLRRDGRGSGDQTLKGRVDDPKVDTLVDKGVGAAVQTLDMPFRIVVHRENDHGNRRLLAKPRHEGDPIVTRQIQVHDHRVRA
jgi:hypothetical protein